MREIPDTWAEAANAAEFPIYEMVEPQPQARWAGGYGWGEGVAVSLEIFFDLDGHEIVVETIGEKPQPLKSVLDRHLGLGMLTESLHGDSGELELPRTWTMDWADQVIEIDGAPVEFTGMTLDDRWTGSASIASGVIVVVACPVHSVPQSLRVAKNWAMPDSRPRHL